MTEEIKPATIKLLTTHKSDDDKLVLYLQGKLQRTELSPKMEEKLDRMLTCADLIRSYGSRQKVTSMMQSITGLSQASAYRIFDDTQRIFGTSAAHDQQFWVDILLGQIQEEIKRARAEGDGKTVASLLKTMKETIKDLLGSGDAGLYDRIQPAVPVIGYWPEELRTKVTTDPEKLKKLIDNFKKSKRKKGYEDEAEEAQIIE